MGRGYRSFFASFCSTSNAIRFFFSLRPRKSEKSDIRFVKGKPYLVCKKCMLIIFYNRPKDDIALLYLSACWVILHTFLSPAEFILNQNNFFNNIFLEYHWAMWVQTVRKGCQQAKEVTASRKREYYNVTLNHYEL